MYCSSYWVISDSGKDNELFYMERGLKGSKFLNFANLEGIHNFYFFHLTFLMRFFSFFELIVTRAAGDNPAAFYYQLWFSS